MSKLFKEYKYRADKKQKDFTISESVFNEMTKSKCLYCDIDFYKEVDGEKVNGIDRFFNDKGYTEANCVPACWQCNRAKSNMSTKEFSDWTKRFVKKNMYQVNNLSVDDFKATELFNFWRSNCSDLKSYERDCIDRAKEALTYVGLFEEIIIDEIIKAANRYTVHKERLVKFMYSVDRLNLPVTIRTIEVTTGIPNYLDKHKMERKIEISHIMEIIDTYNFTKKQKKSLIRSGQKLQKDTSPYGVRFIPLCNIPVPS